MNVSELTGSSTKMSAKESEPADQPSADRKAGKPPNATPTTPRRTGGGNFREAASGWQNPTTTSNAAMTSRTKAVSNIVSKTCWTQEAGRIGCRAVGRHPTLHRPGGTPIPEDWGEVSPSL